MLDYRVVYDAPDEVVVARDDETYPALIFVPVPEAKTVKNRLHLDLNPDDRDREVARLEGLGATRADVGQGPDVSWVVMRDRYVPSWPTSANLEISSPRRVRLGFRPRSGAEAWEPFA